MPSLELLAHVALADLETSFSSCLIYIVLCFDSRQEDVIRLSFAIALAAGRSLAASRVCIWM